MKNKNESQPFFKNPFSLRRDNELWYEEDSISDSEAHSKNFLHPSEDFWKITPFFGFGKIGQIVSNVTAEFFSGDLYFCLRG